MLIKNYFFFIVIAICFFSCTSKEQVKISNPIVDGYYADPSIVFYEGKSLLSRKSG